jgi:hypothetical protein
VWFGSFGDQSLLVAELLQILSLGHRIFEAARSKTMITKNVSHRIYCSLWGTPNVPP